MSNLYSFKSKIFKISKFLLSLSFRYLRKGLLMGLVFVLITGWIFSGWPQIWQNPQIPPEIQEAMADTETKSPDALLTQTNLTGAVTDVDDDPDSPDGLWLTASSNNASIIAETSFPTPTGDPTVGANLQEFRVLVRQFDEGQTGTPDARIELWEDGSLIRAGSDTPVPDGGIVLSFTWNANELATSNGSLVECNVVGTKTGGSPSTRNSVEVGAIEWNVDYSTGPITTFLIGGTETGTKDTAVTTITFPETASGDTTSVPYNNLDGSGDPQVLSADSSEPVVKIKNTHASVSYNIVLEITTWTNSVVNMEYYNLAADGATNVQTVTSELSNASGVARSVSTAVSIDAGAYKDLYLKLTMGSVFGKTGTSTLTVLGETP